MDAFDQYGIIVFQQVVEQSAALSGADDIGKLVRESLMTFVARIINNLHTIIVQGNLLSAAVFETMQMNFYADFVKGLDLMEKIEDPAIIHRVGHVQANNM